MKQKKDRFSPQDVKIEILNIGHNLTEFRSYEQELTDFLLEDSLNNQNQKISITFLWFYKGTLVSYITLLTDKINLEGNLKQFFREKDIHYKALPALKIGRLCVDDNYLRLGLGKLMVLFAIKKANEISTQKAGCRFLTLDAKRNKDKEKDSIHFYKKLGFKILKKRKKGTTPMYLDLKIP
ncbi:MAG: GNAT family N-acetyltransferase [Nanoarchaeota archaeon]|nr:GNAT family N-acetyltransferase [Nanoarchaeota archaeon]